MIDGAKAATPALSWDVAVIGGGPAGLAAAVAARENGAEKVLLLERNDDLGGILNQCIHSGFGLHYFGQELTGPEYAERFVRLTNAAGVTVICGAMVLEVRSEEGAAKRGIALYAIQKDLGWLHFNAGAAVLATGCRERTRGAVGIPGSRPAGVLTAGAAQLYLNVEGCQIGRRVVILGSGDIGLIMARRLVLEVAQVLGVYEVMPYSGGLARNKAQCLDDYGIPLYLSHTITEIKGTLRVEQVTVQQVTADRIPIPGTEQTVNCDTVLLSVGLIPENEIGRTAGAAVDTRTGGPVVDENMETTLPGVFACGNVAHVHDLVDFVTAEAMRAGAAAARSCIDRSAMQKAGGSELVVFENGEGIGYTVPQQIHLNYTGGIENMAPAEIFFRVRNIYKNVRVLAQSGGKVIAAFKRAYMAPGEMERIVLPPKILGKIVGKKAIISISSE